MLVGLAVLMAGSLTIFKLLFLLKLYMPILKESSRSTSFVNNQLSLAFSPPPRFPLLQR